jgi:hypothetical protein
MRFDRSEEHEQRDKAIVLSLWPAERALGIDHPCDRKSSGEENEHDVLKPFNVSKRPRVTPPLC